MNVRSVRRRPARTWRPSCARAAELVTGGKLLVQVFGAGDEQRTCDGIYDVLNDAVLEVLADGLIDRQQYDDYYQPVYFRTLNELTAPFADSTSPASRLLSLDCAESYEVAVPFVEAFRTTGDVARYASEYTDFFRAFTEAVLRASLAGQSGLQILIDDIYARAERLVRNDPGRYEFHYVALAMQLTRQA
nr:hypothetical protein [Accumulibacter sp.]